MQNNISPSIDLEFEISGKKLDELNLSTIHRFDENTSKIVQAIHNVILKKAFEITSLSDLKSDLEKSLSFVDLVKIKLDFSEQPDTLNFIVDSSSIYMNKACVTEASAWIANNDLEIKEEIKNTLLTDNLFGWVYYNEDDALKTFRFILDVSTGEIKYLNN